jgi:hypothetical protein
MGDWASLLNGLNSAVLGEFGREVAYRAAEADDVTVRVIFQPTQQGEENSPGVYGVIFLRLSDLPQTPQRGDRVLIGESAYRVFQIESDGHGAATLSLRVE